MAPVIFCPLARRWPAGPVEGGCCSWGGGWRCWIAWFLRSCIFMESIFLNSMIFFFASMLSGEP